MNDVLADRRIAMLGVPVEIGASQRGTLMGPAALRTAGLATLRSAVRCTISEGRLVAPEVPTTSTSDARSIASSVLRKRKRSSS